MSEKNLYITEYCTTNSNEYKFHINKPQYNNEYPENHQQQYESKI